MITLCLVLLALLFMVLLFMVLTGILAFLPIVLIVAAFIIVDVALVKTIFKKKD